MPGQPDVDTQAASWFSRWRSGKMRPDEHAALKQWLAASPHHRTAYSYLELLWTRLEATRAVPRVLRWREQARR